MSYIGTIVSLCAVVSFIIGPLLYIFMPLKYMFLICSLLILILISLLIFFKENKNIVEVDKNIKKTHQNIKNILNKSLLYLSLCGFIFNYIMSSMFFIAPAYIDELIGTDNMWKIMVPSIIIGIISMRFASNFFEKKLFKKTSYIAFIFLSLGFTLIMTKTIIFVFLGTALIFSGYMILTTGLPSIINEMHTESTRGSANGVFQTSTSLGFFAGPTLTGFLVEFNNNFLICFLPILLSIIGILLIKNFSSIYRLNFLKDHMPWSSNFLNTVHSTSKKN